jgi:uncharacterized protein RhaS with RHS repeats
MYQMHWRTYDANSGQWVSEDPIGFAAGDANTRRYVGNGATNGVDRSGLVDPRWTDRIGDPNKTTLYDLLVPLFNKPKAAASPPLLPAPQAPPQSTPVDIPIAPPKWDNIKRKITDFADSEDGWEIVSEFKEIVTSKNTKVHKPIAVGKEKWYRIDHYWWELSEKEQMVHLANSGTPVVTAYGKYQELSDTKSSEISLSGSVTLGMEKGINLPLASVSIQKSVTLGGQQVVGGIKDRYYRKI